MTRSRYVSIDIETTGIDNSYCQVLEIGAVIDDWVSPVESLPCFHCYVVHDRIVGEPFALSMPGNVQTLRRIAERGRPENNAYLFLKPAEIAYWFINWLEQNGFDPTKTAFTPAGKNFGSFDRGFLKLLPGFDKIKIHSRVIDPAMVFFNPDTDSVPPGTEECMKRAGLDGEVAHTAVADAIAVIRMIRFGFEYRKMMMNVAMESLEAIAPAALDVGPIATPLLAYIQAHNGDPLNKPGIRKDAGRRLAEAMLRQS